MQVIYTLFFFNLVHQNCFELLYDVQDFNNKLNGTLEMKIER